MSKSNHFGIDPYRALWVAVVLQAVRDSCEPYVRFLREKDTTEKAGKERVLQAKLSGAKDWQIKVIQKQNAMELEAVVPYFNSDESQAERWILSDRRDVATSFVNICESIGLDAEAIRQKVVSGTARRWFVDKHKGPKEEAA